MLLSYERGRRHLHVYLPFESTRCVRADNRQSWSTPECTITHFASLRQKIRFLLTPEEAGLFYTALPLPEPGHITWPVTVEYDADDPQGVMLELVGVRLITMDENEKQDLIHLAVEFPVGMAPSLMEACGILRDMWVKSRQLGQEHAA